MKKYVCWFGDQTYVTNQSNYLMEKGCKAVFFLYMKTPPLTNMDLLVEEAF